MLCHLYLAGLRSFLTGSGAEPIMDVAHGGHLELLIPKVEESLRSFVQLLGMNGFQGPMHFRK